MRICRTVFPLIVLPCCMLGNLYAADAEFPLQLKVLDARTEAQKALAQVLDRGGPVTLPEKWAKKWSEQDTESETIRGRGYIAKLLLRNWTGQRDRRLTSDLYLAVASGDIRCAFPQIRWLEVRDDKGNDLIPVWQKEAAARDPAWWQIFGRSTCSGGPDTRWALWRISLDLPDLSARKITVMRGFLTMLVATKWSRGVLEPPTEATDAVLLKDAQVYVRWLREPTGEGRFTDFLRLEEATGARPLPYVGHFSSHQGLVVLPVPRDSRTRPIRLDFARREGSAYDYSLALPDPPPEQLEVRLLAEAALVRVPFEFRDVPIPGMPLADTPDPLRGVPPPRERDLSLEIRAPEKVLEHGEPARLVLRLTNVGKTGFYLDRGQVYEHLSVSWDGGGSSKEEVCRNFLGSPYKEESEDRLVALRPGEFVDLPLVLYSLGKSFGRVTVRAKHVWSSRQIYWWQKVVWKGRSQTAAATVEYEEAPLVELEERLASGERVDAKAARREVQALLDAGEVAAEWRRRIFRKAPRVGLPVLMDLFEEGRGDVARWIDVCLKRLPLEEREKFAARRLAIAEEAVRGKGPIPDGYVRIYLAKHRDVSVEFLESLLARTGKNDRECVASCLIEGAAGDRSTWEAVLRLGDEPEMHSTLGAAFANRSWPLELTRDVYLKTRDKRVLHAIILDGGPSQADLLLNEFAEADAETRLLILWSLAGAGPEVEALARKVLESSAVASERLAALSVIAAGDETEAASLLARVAERDEDGPIRRRAAMLLSDLSGKAPPLPRIEQIALDRAPASLDLPAPEAAFQLAADPESPGRGQALLSLAFLTQEQHLPKVRALLSSPDIPVLRAAIVAGSRLRDAKSASAISRLLKDPPPTFSREFLQRAMGIARSPRLQVPGLFLRFTPLPSQGRQGWGFPEPAQGDLNIGIEKRGWESLRLVLAAPGQAFVILAIAKDIEKGTTSCWYVPWKNPYAIIRRNPPGSTDRWSANCRFSLLARLSDVLDPGEYEVSVDLLALTVSLEEPAFFDSNWDGRRDEFFVPMWGLRRISAGPERITITGKPEDSVTGPRPKRVGLGEVAPADDSTAPKLRSHALRALLGKGIGFLVPPSNHAVEPLLRLAARGDRSILALALEAAESRDAYTAWGGCAARRMLFLATQPEERRSTAAASWLAELYQSAEEFYPAHRVLVPLLIRSTGADAGRSVLARAAKEAPDPWLRYDAAVRTRSLH